MKKICVVTGSRAEYGLMRWLIDGIDNSPLLELQLVVTGMHLSPEFGMTVEAIEKDGFEILKKIEMLLSSDSAVGVTKSMAVGMIGFSDAFIDLKPDMLVVLGDRFEVFAAVTSAMVAQIPIAHLHGGELTEGAVDDALRHAITKMSHLHFVAAEQYRKRVVQLGEHPDRVYNVGAVGIDNIAKIKLLNIDELEEVLQFKFCKRNLLITFHPVTLEPGGSIRQLDELLSALSNLGEVGLIFTMANADAEGRMISEKIKEYCTQHSNARLYASLGQQIYLSCMKAVNCVVGNSSSGIIEAPSIGTPTVNIGMRQSGRLRAKSVLDCFPERKDIERSISLALSNDFRQIMKISNNPYGSGGATDAIVKILEKQNLETLVEKKFYDLKI